MSKNDLKLKLRNFRRFTETDAISFRPGLTIISGPNGAGKSTLVESIIFALYGPKSRKVQDIRNDNSSGDICVECELLIDDQVVRIARTSTAATLWINNTLQVQNSSNSLKEASRQIKALLGGLERDQFERTYVALQGDTAGLVEDKPAERRKIIEKVLQLDVLEKAVELQKETCEAISGKIIAQGGVICDELLFDNTFRGILQQFKMARKPETRISHIHSFVGAIGREVGHRQATVNDATTAVNAAHEEVVSIERGQKKCNQAIGDMERDYKEKEALREKHQGMGTQTANVEGQLHQVEVDLDNNWAFIMRTEEYRQAAEEYARLQSEITRLSERLARLPLVQSRHEAITNAQADLHKLENKLEELSDIDKELSLAQDEELQAKRQRDELNDNDPTSAELMEWQGQNQRLKLEEEQSRQALYLLQTKADEARCPTCNQLFTEHTPEHRIQHLTLWLKEQFPRQLARLNQQKKELDQRTAAWRGEKTTADKVWQGRLAYVSTVRSKVDGRNSLLKDRDEALSAVQKARQEWDELGEQSAYNPAEQPWLEGECQALEEQASGRKEAANMYAQLPALRSVHAGKLREQTSLKVEIQQLRQEQAAVGYDPDALKAVDDALSKARTDLLNIQELLSASKTKLANAQKDADLAASARKRAEQQYNRFVEAVKEFHYEDQLHVLLEDFKKHFFVANTEEIARRTTQLLLHAVTDQSILGIQFDSNEVYYLDASHTPRSISRLSGGEKALVGLCLRIALAEQAQAITRTGKVRFLILDEVLSSLDDERCSAVQQIFEDVQQHGIFEHIIMITHLDTVKHNWQAAELEVQKVSSKTSKVVSVTPGEFSMEFAEEIEV